MRKRPLLNGLTRYRLLAGIFVCVALAAGLAACGSGSGTSTSNATSANTEGSETTASSECSGKPVKIMAVTDLSGAPGSVGGAPFMAGAQGAAEAVTKNCELGGPVEIVECSDDFNANGAAACGRQAVQEKVLAATVLSCCVDNFMPPLVKAGIPTFNTANSALSNTSPTSFPVVFSAPIIMGELTAAASLGAKHITMVVFGIPALKFYTELASGQAKALGVKLDVIEFPPTTTDYSPIAAQVLSSGAEAVVPVTGAGPEILIAKALVAQGADLKNGLLFMDDTSNLNPKTVSQVGPELVDGMVATGFAWATTETSNPAIEEMISELEAAGEPAGETDLTTYTVMAWASVHLTAEALKGHTVSSKELIARLNTSGSIDTEKYGLPPIDYSKPAFPSGPLSKLRLFSKDVSMWEYDESGKPQSLYDGWLNATEKMPIKLLG